MTSPESNHRQRELAAWRMKDAASRKSTGATVSVLRLELTPAQIRRMRSELEDGYSLSTIARRFGVNPSSLKKRLEAP